MTQQTRMKVWMTLLAIAVVVMVFLAFQLLRLPGFGL